MADSGTTPGSAPALELQLTVVRDLLAQMVRRLDSVASGLDSERRPASRRNAETAAVVCQLRRLEATARLTTAFLDAQATPSLTARS